MKLILLCFSRLLLLASVILINDVSYGQHSSNNFSWPSGKRVAVSMSFDDARSSQVEGGTALLDEYDVKATFFVVPSAVEKKLEGWKKAVASGHEIGNHSLTHPCTGNFPWSKQNALEDLTLEKMRVELTDANNRIRKLLGITPEVFAYPCGQTFVGRGINTKSYIPLVAELFTVGRGWLDEGPNDPEFCDLAQITGMEMDGKNFEDILPLIENAKKNNQWLVLAGHEMGESGNQTTRLSMLRKLLEYAKDPSHEIWIVPVGTAAKYIQDQRK